MFVLEKDSGGSKSIEINFFKMKKEDINSCVYALIQFQSVVFNITRRGHCGYFTPQYGCLTIHNALML